VTTKRGEIHLRELGHSFGDDDRIASAQASDQRGASDKGGIVRKLLNARS